MSRIGDLFASVLEAGRRRVRQVAAWLNAARPDYGRMEATGRLPGAAKVTGMNRKMIIEAAIHEYLQEVGYDGYVAVDKVNEMAGRILAALDTAASHIQPSPPK